MDSIYTTTIINAAKERGISWKVLDPVLPVFELDYKGITRRCYNALTDNVGAATFHLAQNKGAANRFLRNNGFPVADQMVYTNLDAAAAFMQSHTCIVVKPTCQWGGRGVSTHIENREELEKAVEFARQYGDEILLEDCVCGIDWRLIYINFKYVCAIQRNPATVTGNGKNSIYELIQSKNQASQLQDPSHVIPLDRETGRTLAARGLTQDSIPAPGSIIQVRRTTNYHTGGTIDIVTNAVAQSYIRDCRRVACLLDVPVLGVDILADLATGQFNIIELSPDLAISPPEGAIVVEAWLDYLFPDSMRCCIR